MNILAALIIVVTYGLVAYVTGSVFMDSLMAERNPILEQNYWMEYTQKGPKPKKRTYAFAWVAGLFWPIVIVAGIIEIGLRK